MKFEYDYLGLGNRTFVIPVTAPRGAGLNIRRWPTRLLTGVGPRSPGKACSPSAREPLGEGLVMLSSLGSIASSTGGTRALIR